MRDQINERFKDVRNKWVYVPLNKKEFKDIVQEITVNIHSGNLKVAEAISLIKIFKEKKTAWIKFKSVKGRTNQFCSCEIITHNNKKININVSCDFIINSEILSDTPKSLKLYKSSLKRKKMSPSWKKTDSFSDNVDTPLEEEFTEEGYRLYKSYYLEKHSN
tara:strand:- start:947 stop:1432 length:486 start_codon:yes stop_codon:yes gene_type:complete